MTPDSSDRPSHRGPVLDAWREAFVLELRALDVAGARIGDALAEVDAHCAETGQPPEASFGEPEAYAADLAESLPADARVQPAGAPELVVSGLAVLFGIGLLFGGLDGIVDGGPAAFSVGSLLGMLVVGGICAVVVVNLSTLLRRGHLWWLAALLAAGFVVPAATGWFAPRPVLVAPAWPCLVVGLALLGAGGASLGRGGADLVVDPRTGRESFHTPRWMTLVATALLPMVLLVGVVLLLALR